MLCRKWAVSHVFVARIIAFSWQWVAHPCRRHYHKRDARDSRNGNRTRTGRKRIWDVRKKPVHRRFRSFFSAVGVWRHHRFLEGNVCFFFYFFMLLTLSRQKVNHTRRTEGSEIGTSRKRKSANFVCVARCPCSLRADVFVAFCFRQGNFLAWGEFWYLLGRAGLLPEGNGSGFPEFGLVGVSANSLRVLYRFV